MSEQIDKIFREKLGRHKAPVSSAPDIWAAIAADQARKRKRARMTTVGKYAGLLLLLVVMTWSAFTYLVPPVDESARVDDGFKEVPALMSPAENEETAVASVNTDEATAERSNDIEVSEQLGTKQFPQSNRQAVDSALSPNGRGLAARAIVSTETGVDFEVTDEQSTQAPSIQEEIAPRSQFVTTDRSAKELPTLPLPILSPRSAEAPSPVANALEQEQASFNRSKRKRLEIDLLAGPAYANQIFNLDDEADRELLNAREISEFPTVSFLAGVRASYRLSSRWSVRTGLLFTQIRNQFEYEQRSSTPGESTILIKSSNQINMLEVPLLASFTLPGKRFRLALNAGPVINLSTSANGRYLLPDLMEPVNLEEDNIYRGNVGLSYQFSFTAAYDLGMGNSLLIEPTFKNYRSSFTHRDYALNERYWLAGLQIGLRHRIR